MRCECRNDGWVRRGGGAGLFPHKSTLSRKKGEEDELVLMRVEGSGDLHAPESFFELRYACLLLRQSDHTVRVIRVAD